jgi:hypothetical protein
LRTDFSYQRAYVPRNQGGFIVGVRILTRSRAELTRFALVGKVLKDNRWALASRKTPPFTQNAIRCHAKMTLLL